MARRNIHIHIHDNSVRAMTPNQLVMLWKNPGENETRGGEAIQELVRRGLDPRTGKNVGYHKALEIARQIGDFGQS